MPAGLLLTAAALAGSHPVAAAEVSGQLSGLSRALQESRAAADFDALESFAESAAGSQRSLAWFSVGMAHYRAKDYPEAEAALARASDAAGWLGEYASYYLARCVSLAEDFERSLGVLKRFDERYPRSRFRAASERLRVESLLRLRRLEEARSLVAAEGSRLDEPVRLYLAARVEHVDGDWRTAVGLYRQAYYRYPLSDQAKASESHLNRIRRSVGAAYPSAPAQSRLERAGKLYDSRSYAAASAEFTRALSAGLAGPDRDLAAVRRGAADYHRGQNSTAYTALARARPSQPALDAERLYLLAALERRQGLVRAMRSSLAKLSDRHAGSNWYQEALLSIGNFYFLRDDRPEYLRWFRRLYEAFPEGEHAPYAHWKVTWRAWLDRAGDRQRLLAEHAERYPAAPTAASALYWLGRLHELEGRHAESQGHFLAVLTAFPHFHYAGLARERLASSVAGADLARRIVARLPARRRLAEEPSEYLKERFQVGDALAALGLDEEALGVFREADFRAEDAPMAGLRLARLHSRNGQPHLAVRALKRFAFGYLRMPLRELSDEYWNLLYPLEWKQELWARSERHGLDPYLVAGLIRQESEFDPRARSGAGAIGLMQIMPATGRGLFRRLGISGYSSRKLEQPDISLRLGTFHLKEVLEDFGGSVEQALAAYNAGERRIPGWLKLGPFDEPAEFVETIPFSQTRGYVQSVLRNRAMYERIYGRY